MVPHHHSSPNLQCLQQERYEEEAASGPYQQSSLGWTTTELHSLSIWFLQVVNEVYKRHKVRLLMHIHTQKYMFPHLQEVKVLEHMSNLLSISALIEEIQLQGQILLSFFHQPHELKIWKDLLHNQEENLRTKKQTINSTLAPKPCSYTQCCFDRIIPCNL